MNNLKEIATAYKKINEAYTALSLAFHTPDLVDVDQIYLKAQSVAVAAKKVMKLCEKYNLPYDTVYHLVDELEFAVWVKAQNG